MLVILQDYDDLPCILVCGPRWLNRSNLHNVPPDRVSSVRIVSFRKTADLSKKHFFDSDIRGDRVQLTQF